MSKKSTPTNEGTTPQRVNNGARPQREGSIKGSVPQRGTPERSQDRPPAKD
ncbi:MAG: hypothetical protein PF441_00240 [Desulfuromusa sp.]|jgi:hypothetical protein|nr:hypothetical protein [Desulfuromusa sp.]